eukprot:GHVR01005816.1.p1 GENE.GHVR01005816.1~~GHVR01005816.1.p1  ORF type:complete len:208 (+),score=52.67 GHVR01005816.1:20-643(+)
MEISFAELEEQLESNRTALSHLLSLPLSAEVSHAVSALKEAIAALEPLIPHMRSVDSAASPHISTDIATSSSVKEININEGRMCVYPYRELNGSVSYHIGTIKAVLYSDSVPQRVHVIQTAPVDQCQLPCTHLFQNNKCKYGHTCRFSHGHWLSVDLIERYEFDEFDKFDEFRLHHSLCVGRRALVRVEGSSLFSLATIERNVNNKS